MAACRMAQQSFLDGGEPPVSGARLADRLGEDRRRWLDDDAWIEYLPGWVPGHDAIFAALARNTRWRHEQRRMYDRLVDVPRLIATLPHDGPGHPLLDEARALLSARYGVEFGNPSLAFYRDGNDSVAWHGDYVARHTRQAHVATISVGEPRRFLLRRKTGERKTGERKTGERKTGERKTGERSIAYKLGWGDLIVMGGTCQRTWQHAIPKVAAAAGPRIAVVFRDFEPKRYGARPTS